MILLLLALDFMRGDLAAEVRPNQEQEGGQQDQRATAEQAAEKGPGIPTAATTPNADAQSGNNEERGHPEAQSSEKPAGWLDWLATEPWGDTLAQWIMMGAGILALFVSIWAVWLVRKTWLSTQEGVAVTRQSAERQLRAYVSIGPAGIEMDMRSRNLVVKIGQKNNGQTPAREVRFGVRHEWWPYPLPKHFEIQPVELKPDTNVVHPGHTFTVPYVCEGCDVVTISNNSSDTDRRLYIVARIEYFDMLDTRRETIACWSYDSRDLSDAIENSGLDAFLGETPDKPITPEFDYADRHNSIEKPDS